MLVYATLEGSFATLKCLSYFLALTVVAFYAFFFPTGIAWFNSNSWAVLCLIIYF